MSQLVVFEQVGEGLGEVVVRVLMPHTSVVV
jgi:hypothetical protein